MNNKTLFPVIDQPVVNNDVSQYERHYKASADFDFEQGDFILDGSGKIKRSSGKEAWIQWCIKSVMTQRLAHLAYSADYGCELEEALSETDHKALISSLERTISEALMVNPRTEYVRDFSFEQENDALKCSFVVKGHEWEEVNIEQITISL